MIRLFIILALISYAPKQMKSDDYEHMMSPDDAELVVAHELADGNLVRMIHRI